jgi:hypothetical protein
MLKLPTMYLYFFTINYKQPTDCDYRLLASSWIILIFEHKEQSFHKFPQFIEFVCCVGNAFNSYTVWTFSIIGIHYMNILYRQEVRSAFFSKKVFIYVLPWTLLLGR